MYFRRFNGEEGSCMWNKMNNGLLPWNLHVKVTTIRFLCKKKRQKSSYTLESLADFDFFNAAYRKDSRQDCPPSAPVLPYIQSETNWCIDGVSKHISGSAVPRRAMLDNVKKTTLKRRFFIIASPENPRRFKIFFPCSLSRRDEPSEIFSGSFTALPIASRCLRSLP